MSETLFILGAGASKHTGAPLMKEFCDQADELRKAGNLGEYQLDFEKITKVISDLQAVHSKSTMDIVNVESIFAAIEMGRLINKLPSSSSDEDPNTLHKSMIRYLFITIENSIKYQYTQSKIQPHNAYDLFGKMLFNMQQANKRKYSSVISFNYDIALEYALQFRGIPYNYCIEDNPNENDLRLLKLHGSLNWGSCQECKKIVPWSVSAFASTLSAAFFDEHQMIPLRIGSKLEESELKCCERFIDPVPVIVPPIWNKTQYHTTIAGVWQNAAKELEDAENIFVIGYSLPESDAFFRYLYALGTVSSKVLKRFWVFDPDETGSVKKRFEEMIGTGARSRFQYYSATFREALDIVARENKVSLS